ncbi:MAG TPA: hypothetical protein VFG14_20265, partial [Chthoniobacteraceae bacterium]|nr:hypothetical protein [Chthoniobacteraceae bacterium]
MHPAVVWGEAGFEFIPVENGVHEFVGEVGVGVIGPEEDDGGQRPAIADGNSLIVEREWLGLWAAFVGEVDVEADRAIGAGNGKWFAHEAGELGPEIAIDFASDSLGAGRVIRAAGRHPGDADFAAGRGDGGPLDLGEDRGLAGERCFGGGVGGSS